MQFSTTARKTTITDGMKGSIESKLAFLNKFLKEDTEVHVTVEIVTDKELRIEALFVHDGIVFKAEAVDTDFYFGLDTVADKLKKQISKHKDIKKSVRGSGHGFDGFDGYENHKDSGSSITKRKKFNMKPMLEEEAVLSMEMLGHSSFIFMNADLDCTMCLLYKKKDGKYGIIEGTFDEDEE